MSYIAKKANRVIRIHEEKADEYAKMGYSVLDDSGEVVKQPNETTLEGAMRTIKALREEIEDKDAAIATLKEEIAGLKAKNEEGEAAKAPKKTSK